MAIAPAGASTGGAAPASATQATVVKAGSQLAPGAPHGAAVQKLTAGGKSREERLAQLQAKLDKLYPPFTSVDGTWTRELEAVIPLPGERYAGEGCARWRVC